MNKLIGTLIGLAKSYGNTDDQDMEGIWNKDEKIVAYKSHILMGHQS